MRQAPETQINSFWKIIDTEMKIQIDNKPEWLSTSDLKVCWLQARIDTYPKYYQTSEYKVL